MDFFLISHVYIDVWSLKFASKAWKSHGNLLVNGYESWIKIPAIFKDLLSFWEWDVYVLSAKSDFAQDLDIREHFSSTAVSWLLATSTTFLVHHFGPDWTVSANFWWIVMRFCTNIYVPNRINCSNAADPLNFHLELSPGQSFNSCGI